MNQSTDYTPPATETMKARQNDIDALRLLIAQRRLYRRAKRWLGTRWLGMVAIGIGAPVVSILSPSLAVVAGAVAGLWLFAGRTVLFYAQMSLTSRAASVQEQFDFYVFGMPDSANRSSLPTLEEIAATAGPDNQIATVASGEELLNWYPFDESQDGVVAVAIAQRANVSYTDRLLRSTAITWALATALWTVALIIWSVASDVSLSAFLLGVALPVLPAFLDVVQHVTGVWRSAKERRDLAKAIENRLASDEDPVEGEDLLVWQERLFDLRRSAPDVPDLLYRLRRTVNEQAMHTAADQLGRRAGGSN